MPCSCEQVAPCRVPELVTLPSYSQSESHALVLDPMPSSYESGLSPTAILVGMTILVAALSRHFRARPLCVLNLAGRSAAPALRAERPAGRPFRLVLSARERAALGRIREAWRSAFRWTTTAARPPLPGPLAEVARMIRS
jgi:hypothetical protein